VPRDADAMTVGANLRAAMNPGSTPLVRWRPALRNVLDLAAVAVAVGFVASYFPPKVMLTATTTNGGDMGSHVYAAQYLRDVLLPQGRVTGWCPGNYCGFPLFQLYFPLSFVLMAATSLVTSLNVAFKIGTVLGTFLLPPCAYLGLRLGGIPFPGPALGALSTLCFLFMEANSMWGGNIPSTLAGEFAFSLGLALAVLFIGTLRWTIETGRGRAWNGLLVALIGFAHGYTLIWAGFTSLAELIVLRGWWRRVGVLVAVHGLAILLLGFWLFPLLAYTPWTTVYSYVWVIGSWREIVPPILWPAAIVAVVTAIAVGVVAYFKGEPYPRGLATVWAGTLIGVVFYFTAHAFNVVDIRFLPFMQLGLCLAAAGGVGHLVSRLPAPELWPLVGALAIVPFVQARISFIPSWISWNYSGFEKKGPWPTFRDVNERVRGDFRDPRVVFEHSPDHEALGTIRAFENLPLFSGRSTLEGLYMQASQTAPFVFFIQSEVSNVTSCPFPHWGCSRLDLDRGVDHLRMFNVSHYIVRSPQVKAVAAKHPGLEHDATVGAYEIYRVKQNDGRYAVPLEVAPSLVVAPTWKESAYRWFKTARPGDPIPVFAPAASEEEKRAFAAAYDALPRELPREPLAPAPTLAERLETDRITVTGCRPGHPVLVRISYHPRWRSLGGERVWLAAPSFMLVFPKGERIDLVFDGGWPVTLGHLFTAVGCIVFLAAVLPVRRRLATVLRPALELPPIPAGAALLRSTGGWTMRVRLAVLGAGLGVAAVVFGLAAVAARATDADGLYRQGQVVYNAGRLGEAVVLFRAAQRLAPLSSTAIHSTYFEAISLFRQDQWAEAEKAFRRLLANFPEAQAAAESLYHVGICRARLGDQQGALEAWEETERRFAGSPWAGHAHARLAEIPGRGTGG
jgi:tetratricopeptide (TPR) repeat protein